MVVQAGIVVTGTEVLTGRVSDRNGGWLAEELRRLGVDIGQIVVVGDRAEDLRQALVFLTAANDLVVTSGGLGPTADDLTAQVVAEVQGRPLRLDPDLEQRITAIVERLSARFGGVRDPEATALATRKQAHVPEGATVLEPAGTAPGLVVHVAEGRDGPPVVVLPGPPWELRQLWPAAVSAPDVQAVLASAAQIRQHTLRLWGVPESELAATLRRHEGELAGLEITTCLRAGELEIVTRYGHDAEPAQQRLLEAVRSDFADRLFSEDGTTVDDLVAAELSRRGWTVASVETASGGALSSSMAGMEVAVGSLSARAPSALPTFLEVPAAADGNDRELARALADGARSVFGSDVGIGAAGTSLAVRSPAAERTRSLPSNLVPDIVHQLLGPAALHLVLELLDTQ